jgi:hypothetical protein
MEVLYQLSYSPVQNASRTYHRIGRGTIGLQTAAVWPGTKGLPGGVQAPMNLRLVPQFVLSAVLVVGCGSQQTTTKPSTPRTAAAATKQWKANHPVSYRFHYSVGCFCPPLSGVITVTDGAVTDWVADPPRSGETARRVTLADLPTVDSLLEEAARADREATGPVEITYDETTGVPMRASIDWLEKAIDDEVGWTVTDFTTV